MQKAMYWYLWAQHQAERLRERLEDERGDILGEYGFLFVGVAIAALAGLFVLGGRLNNFFVSKIAGYFK